jgi:hypothetical protein
VTTNTAGVREARSMTSGQYPPIRCAGNIRA